MQVNDIVGAQMVHRVRIANLGDNNVVFDSCPI